MDAVLQTKRLLLRRARLSDRDAYLELRNSPYVMDSRFLRKRYYAHDMIVMAMR